MKYTRLFNKLNELTHYTNAIRGEEYKMYIDDPYLYTFKKGDEREYFSLKNDNPFANFNIESSGGGESFEHYEAKMKIAYEKKYYDTIFEKEIYFDDVIPEKKVLGGKIPDLKCYINKELVLIIEIFNTNQKTTEDIEHLKKAGVPVVEININNANECKHLILPKVLEFNKREYTEIRAGIIKAKERRKDISIRAKKEFTELDEQYRVLKIKSKSGIGILSREIEGIEKTIDRYKEEIRGIEESGVSDESVKSKLDEYKEKLRRANDEIKRIERHNNDLEESFKKIAKDCNIEWFANKWMNVKGLNKINDFIYWTS